jgi:hypothetical protein
MLSCRDDLLTDVWAARLFTRDRPYNLVLGIASNTRVGSALQLLSRGLTEPSNSAPKCFGPTRYTWDLGLYLEAIETIVQLGASVLSYQASGTTLRRRLSSRISGYKPLVRFISEVHESGILVAGSTHMRLIVEE